MGGEAKVTIWSALISAVTALLGAGMGAWVSLSSVQTELKEAREQLATTSRELEKSKDSISDLSDKVERSARALDTEHATLFRDAMDPKTPAHIRIAVVAGMCAQKGADGLRRSAATVAAHLAMICDCSGEGASCSDACAAAKALTAKDTATFEEWLRSDEGGCDEFCVGKASERGASEKCSKCVQRELTQFSAAIGVCAREDAGAVGTLPASRAQAQ